MRTTIRVLFVTLYYCSIAVAQPSGEIYRRAGIIGGNKVITTFLNDGVIGQPATSGSRGAWLYPTNGYIGDMSVFIGVELPLRDYNGDGIPDTVHSVITCPVLRPVLSRDIDPMTGKYWTFEPEGGYFNATQQSPAIRSHRDTWPDLWPDHPEWGVGKWNGLRGPDSLTGDDESFFRMDDRNDERFNSASNNPRGIAFHPDSINPTRTGQGISLSVRYIQSANPFFSDILFRVYDITNEGTIDYAKVVFGTLTGTYIGVTNTEDTQEWSNDVSIYFPSSDFILTWNVPENGVRNPYWQGSVGMFGEALVEAPSGDHIASCDVFVPSGALTLGDDESLWGRLKPGRYVNASGVIDDTVAISVVDMDYMYASNYFALKAGETKRVVAVLAYGYQKEEVKQKILMAKALWNSNFRPDVAYNAVSITNLSTHRVLSGMQSLQWTTSQVGGTVTIWYSSDAGSTWTTLAAGIPNTGSTTWNTANYPDAAFGLLRIIVADSTGTPYGFHESTSSFTVDNLGNGLPFVRILNSALSAGAVITQPEINLPLLIGDPERGPLEVTFSYRVNADAPFVPFESYIAASDTLVQSHSVSLAGLPNSPSFQLKVVVSDGVGTWGDSTAVFDKQTMRPFFPPTQAQFTGPSQVPISVLINDSSRTRSDTYVITFCDTAFAGPKTFSVRDSTRHSRLLSDTPFYPGIETASFDGLSLLTPDIVTVQDTARSYWNRAFTGVSRIYSMTVLQLYLVSYKGYRQPFDYRVVFDNNIVDTSAAFDIAGLTPMPVNFRVYDMQTDKKVKVAAWGSYGYRELVLLEDVAGHERATWDVFLSFNPPDSFARSGDTLYLFTKKGLSFHDTLKVLGLTLSVPPGALNPLAYALYQNYPNPFNPSTTIRYALPRRSNVTLGLYTILGQRVRTIVQENQEAGPYEVKFDGSGLASGVYFYRIQAGSFMQTKKLLLLR